MHVQYFCLLLPYLIISFYDISTISWKSIPTEVVSMTAPIIYDWIT